MKKNKSTWRAGLVTLLAISACGAHNEGLRAGALDRPLVLSSADPEVQVRGVMAGVRSTNIWIDVSVAAKAQDAEVVPGDFSLFVPATGVTIPASQRHFEVSPGYGWGPVVPPGGRDPHFRGGSAEVSPPAHVPASAKINMTLLFETAQEEAKGIEQVDLGFRGHRIRLGRASR
jgi:hypothetical protein